MTGVGAGNLPGVCDRRSTHRNGQNQLFQDPLVHRVGVRSGHANDLRTQIFAGEFPCRPVIEIGTFDHQRFRPEFASKLHRTIAGG